MTEWLNSLMVAAVVSAVVSLIINAIQLREQRAAMRVASERDLAAKFDKMVSYRLEHPEVLSLASRWSPACFRAIYNQETAADRAWAHYYGYVELCVAYCSAALYARSRRLIDPILYEKEHEPLIRLVLVEHWPLLHTISVPHGYSPQFLVEHVAALRASGWDWEGEHRRYVRD